MNCCSCSQISSSCNCPITFYLFFFFLSVTVIGDERPSHKDVPALFFPIAQADIYECSTYAVVCRRKSFWNYSRALGREIMLRHFTLFTRKQPRRASFAAYFRPDIPNILVLICCSAHLQQEVIQDLEKTGVMFAVDSSIKGMIPGEDNAIVFLSGGIRPFDEEEVNNIYLR